MPLSDLRKAKAGRVLGIDCSTHSLAWCIVEEDKPVTWGKVTFDGSNVFERMADASNKVRAIRHMFDVDYIAFEAAIMAKVKNPDVTIKLAMVYGACISELMRTGTEVVTVPPLSWQTYLNNPNFKKPEKEELKLEFPNKSAVWYSAKIRELRKQKTMNFFNERWPTMNITDNDVGDACGIAYYAYNNLTRR